MRDGFDPMVADRFKVLDDVAVPDTWSRVQSKVPDLVPVRDRWSPVQLTEEVVTMIDLTPAPPKAPRRTPTWSVVAALSAAAVAAGIIDVDGTVVILNTRVLAGQPAASHAELAAVLDSVRISQG